MERRGHTRFDAVTLLVFALSLILPGLGLLGGLREGTSRIENRVLAKLPEWPQSGPGLARFAEEFEAYANDHVGGRVALFRTYSAIAVVGLSRSPTSKVVLGKEGWLFWAGDGALDQYRGTARFSDAELRRWGDVLAERSQWLASQGISYLFVIAPNKHSVYPEFMPENIHRTRNETRLDQLLAHLETRQEVEVIDLRDALRNAKGERALYYRTDSHWNADGAWVAQRAILEAGGRHVSGLVPGAAASFERSTRASPGFGLAGLIGQRDRFRDTMVAWVHPRARSTKQAPPRVDSRPFAYPPKARGTHDPSQPRAVLFQDSFGNALQPYFDEAFQRIVYAWSFDVDPVLIEAESPDLVIHLVVERFLHRAPLSLADVRARKPREEAVESDSPRGSAGR